MGERQRFRAGTKRPERLADGSVVQRAEPQALNRAAIIAEFENFPSDHLAFAIRVRSDDELGRASDELLDSSELRCRRGLYLHAPAIGNNWQLLNRPAPV